MVRVVYAVRNWSENFGRVERGYAYKQVFTNHFIEQRSSVSVVFVQRDVIITSGRTKCERVHLIGNTKYVFALPRKNKLDLGAYRYARIHTHVTAICARRHP